MKRMIVSLLMLGGMIGFALNTTPAFADKPDGGHHHDGGGGDQVEICHFKKFLKHCEISGEPMGGGLRTVSEDKVAGHEAHGDCTFPDIYIPQFCPNHCLCVVFEPDGV